jgi:integrase
MREEKTPYSLALNRRGLWEVRWSEHNGQRGVTRTFSTGERDRAEADLKAQAFWDTRHIVLEREDATRVNDCADGYLRALMNRGASPGQRWALSPVKRILGSRVVVALNADDDDIQAYRELRKAEGVGNGRIRRELGALIAALNWAVKQKRFGLTKHDLPDVELGPDSAPRRVTLNAQEARDFWALALADLTPKGHLSRVARYVALALAAAQRKEANLNLTWDRVDFARGMIDFRVPGVAENNKRQGLTPIADRLRPVLERAKAESEARGEPASALVCSKGSIRGPWEAWVKRTPYSHIRIHDLRRTWASLAVQAGAPIYEVASVLHDNVATVQKHYSHFAPEHLKSVINVV